jgi:hypothetical protein
MPPYNATEIRGTRKYTTAVARATTTNAVTPRRRCASGRRRSATAGMTIAAPRHTPKLIAARSVKNAPT